MIKFAEVISFYTLRVKIGALFMSDTSRPSSEILKAAAKQFGTKSKEDEQKKSSQVGTACPANAGYVFTLLSFHELILFDSLCISAGS